MMEITAEIRALIDKAAAGMELAGDEYIAPERHLPPRGCCYIAKKWSPVPGKMTKFFRLVDKMRGGVRCCLLYTSCSLPQLFAACQVLLRLPVPRHPPCALLCLTNLSLAFSSLFCVAACSFVSYIHSYAPSSFARAPCLKRKILRDACLH